VELTYCLRLKAEKIDCYRNKAQLPFDLSGKAGFFAFHSHRVVPCNNCKLQPKVFSDIIKAVEEYIKQNKITIYNEETNEGLLRHIYLRQAEKTGQIMLTLVINGDSLPKEESFVAYITEKFDYQICSIQLNINKSKTNVILGDKCVLLYGEEYIKDILCEVTVRLSPLSFYQVNRDMAEKLYKKVKVYANPENKNILDLYCGAGTIGLSMAKSANSLIGVEIIPKAIEDAKQNAKENGITNSRFICADAAKAAQMLLEEKLQPDVCIVDPPRKGCDSRLISIIANDFKPERVVYVSCDPATLARDLKLFDELGYKLKCYTPVDLFPRTAHVETVALLSRQKVDEHIYLDVNVQDLPKTTRTTATYPEIKAYIKDKYGLNVTSLNIAQIKEKHGFEKRENYNKGKEGHRVPNCPPEKEKAIEDAFKHFGML